jgi:calcineurin-like phosphoesterase family protein
MNEKMINKWNATVQPNDIVIHLGDFALHKESDKVKETCNQLKGRKVLVRGNHDRKSISWYLNNGFDFVCDSFVIGRIIFTHRPMRKQDLILSNFDFNIHGHLHEKDSPNNELYENVSVERTNYYPINLDSILGKHGLKLKRKNKQGD